MIQRVAIIGGHIQALGLARQVKKKGVEVVLLVESAWSVARFSNCVTRTCVYNSKEELLQLINQMQLPNRATLLFPTNDEAVEILTEHYSEYQSKYALGVPNPEVVNLFNNKRNAYQFATANGIPAPACWYPNRMEDVEQLSIELPYPIVVKPAIMYSFHSTFGKKAFRCDNAEELIQIFQRIDAANYPIDSILIQEFLSGGPKYLYSYGVFAADGKPVVSLMANRIRQNPMDFGNSTTFAVTCDIDAIKQQSEALLHQVKYFGLGEVEWMYDPHSKTYKFLEINTRAWKWHTICNQLGHSFIEAMIDYYNGVEVSHTHYSGQAAWVERLTDWTVICKEVLKGRMKLSEAYRIYQQTKENAVWSWRDPMPGVMYILMSPVLYVKRF